MLICDCWLVYWYSSVHYIDYECQAFENYNISRYEIQCLVSLCNILFLFSFSAILFYFTYIFSPLFSKPKSHYFYFRKKYLPLTSPKGLFHIEVWCNESWCSNITLLPITFRHWSMNNEATALYDTFEFTIFRCNESGWYHLWETRLQLTKVPWEFEPDFQRQNGSIIKSKYLLKVSIYQP